HTRFSRDWSSDVCSSDLAGMVWAKGIYHIWVKTALYHFAIQLLFNTLWCIIFFGLENPFGALLVILTLLILLIFTIKWFKVVDRTDRKSTRLNSSHVKISYA